MRGDRLIKTLGRVWEVEWKEHRLKRYEAWILLLF